MEMRAFGCFVLAYVSVYALFWLFDHRDALVTSEAPTSFKVYLCQVGAGVLSYFQGFLAYAARSFNLKGFEVGGLPRAIQLWFAIAGLFIVSFFFSRVLCAEAFHLLFLEHIALLGLIVFFPLLSLAKKRFAQRPNSRDSQSR